ncbi:MAG: hypothetical protein WCI01_07185 [Chlorobiaceae bacterium]
MSCCLQQTVEQPFGLLPNSTDVSRYIIECAQRLRYAEVAGKGIRDG